MKLFIALDKQTNIAMLFLLLANFNSFPAALSQNTEESSINFLQTAKTIGSDITKFTTRTGFFEPSQHKTTLALLTAYYLWHRKQLNSINREYSQLIKILKDYRISAQQTRLNLMSELMEIARNQNEAEVLLPVLAKLKNSIAKLKNLKKGLLASLPAGIFNKMTVGTFLVYFLFFFDSLRRATNDTIADLELIHDILENKNINWQQRLQYRYPKAISLPKPSEQSPYTVSLPVAPAIAYPFTGSQPPHDVIPYAQPAENVQAVPYAKPITKREWWE